MQMRHVTLAVEQKLGGRCRAARRGVATRRFPIAVGAANLLLAQDTDVAKSVTPAVRVLWGIGYSVTWRQP